MHLIDLKAGLSQTTSAFWQQCTGYASLTAVGHQESPDPLAQASTFLPKKQITVRPTFLVRAKCVAYIASQYCGGSPEKYNVRPMAVYASQSLLLITDRDPFA